MKWEGKKTSQVGGQAKINKKWEGWRQRLAAQAAHATKRLAAEHSGSPLPIAL